MSEFIKPALTAKQWSARATDRWYFGHGGGLTIELRKPEPAPEITFDEEERYALAAVALHFLPNGFLWADVDLLRRLVKLAESKGIFVGIEDPGLTIIALDELSDRIAALLPPRTR